MTHDNNIIVEFDVDCCFVKDKITGKELLRGRLKDGLYQLSESYNKSNDPCAYISIKESWHRKLGHPNNKVLDKVLKNCKIKTPPSDSDHHTFYEACQFRKMHLLPFKSSGSHALEHL